jgi:hypothetical protein
MCKKVWSAVLLLGLGAGTASAQAAQQNQPPAMPMGGMEHMSGMAMGRDTATDPCKGMETGSGMSMDMGKKMEMGEGKGMDAMKKPAVPAGPLKIVFGDKSAEWTPATLASLPHKTVTVCNIHVKASQTYTGVSLMELLTRLGVPAMQHGKDLRLYLVAEGSDGYQAVYSVAEVNPDAHDAAVIVADSVDGKPLAGSGPLQLVAAGDKRPARWVRNLVAVRVLTAQ